MEKVVPYNEKNRLLSDADLSMLLNEYGVTAKYNNIDIYRCAMVHKSYCTRKNENFYEGNIECPPNCIPLQEESNERLEFLGDSVLGTVIAAYLFERYPDENEGFLTRLRTKIVNGKMLAKLCKTVGLNKYILLSKQIEDNDGRNISNILEDSFEAFLAAVYLDFDYQTAQSFIINVIETHLDFSELIITNTNYKDQILKYFQHTHGYIPKFYEVDVETNSHNHKTFKICLRDKHNNIISRGQGSSKKDAENMAAKTALESLCIEFSKV